MKRKFRLGSTSYVYPDNILPNARQLAPVVDDIELVLFQVDDYGTNLPDAAAIAELNALARDHALTYTVHLPIDLDWRDARTFEKIYYCLDATRALYPFAYILHLDGRMLMGQPAPETVSHWQAQTALALDDMLTRIEPAQLCIENIERWSPEYFAGLVAEKRLARCIDVGHLWVQGRDPVLYLRQNLERTRVIHIHGVGGPSGRDHQSLARQPRDEVFRVLDLLAEEEFKGVLTLEVFGLDDFVSSRQVIEEWENNSR